MSLYLKHVQISVSNESSGTITWILSTIGTRYFHCIFFQRYDWFKKFLKNMLTNYNGDAISPTHQQQNSAPSVDYSANHGLPQVVYRNVYMNVLHMIELIEGTQKIKWKEDILFSSSFSEIDILYALSCNMLW